MESVALKKEIAESVELLLSEVQKLSVASGHPPPKTRARAHWSFPDFKYGMDGPLLGGGRVVEDKVLDWSEAAQRVLDSIRFGESFSRCVAAVAALDSPTLQPVQTVEATVREFTQRALADPESVEEIRSEESDLFRRNLLGLPVPHSADVRLTGILIPGDIIEFRHRDVEFTLRQTRRIDVELPFGNLGGPSIHTAPDAILEVRMQGHPFLEIQEQEERALTLLRLFTNAPLQVLSTQHRLYGSGRDAGLSWQERTHPTWRKATLTPSSQVALQCFFDSLYDRLTTPFYKFGEPSLDPQSVAHERFKDAMTNGNLFEHCVMNAVMGLEALFFKPTGEQAELAYRLGLRVARFTSLLGKDPLDTRELIKDAYKVRSGYVHGGRASSDDKRGIRRGYGQLIGFQAELLDLLRVSIVACLIRPIDKDEFVDHIDDSMVARDRCDQLSAALSSARSVLSNPL
jgi:hypothetical protein